MGKTTDLLIDIQKATFTVFTWVETNQLLFTTSFGRFIYIQLKKDEAGIFYVTHHIAVQRPRTLLKSMLIVSLLVTPHVRAGV